MTEMQGISITDRTLSTDRQSRIPAILTIITNPIGYVQPVPSSGNGEGCTGRVQLDKIAEHNAKLCINGAPFNMDTGACIG